jgi:uridine phosphorylase
VASISVFRTPLICDSSEQDKLDFLKLAHDKGVRNIEMEATLFSAFTNHLNIEAADVCVALLNRLEGDQVAHSADTMAAFDSSPG